MPKKSNNARAVAQDVIKTVIKGEKVVLGAIIEKHGYTKSTAINPRNITDQLAYKEEIIPFVDKMIALRDKAMAASHNKDLNKEAYHTLVGSIDTLTKNIQLLSGEDTDRQGVTIKIISYKDADNDTT